MQDPLSINIKQEGVDTSFPLMAEGDYDFQITESLIKPNKKQTGFNWSLKLASISAIPSVDGKEIAPNAAVFLQIALQPSEEATDPRAFVRGISDATDAIFGTTKDNRPDFNKELWESAVGKTVRAHIVLDEWQGVKNNKVKRLKKAV